MAYDLIIFDCDGTLVDTEYLNNFATIELLHEQGLTQYTMAHALNSFVGIRFNQILQTISDDTDHIFPDDMSERYVEKVKDMIEDGEHFNMLDGAKKLVELAAKTHKICVASNGQRGNVLRSLKTAEILPYFDESEIFTGIEVANPKPAPDLFLLAAEKMGAEPSKTLVLEDSPAGVIAGVAANMSVFGFSGAHENPESHAKSLKEQGADEVFTSLIHIHEFLSR